MDTLAYNAGYVFGIILYVLMYSLVLFGPGVALMFGIKLMRRK